MTDIEETKLQEEEEEEEEEMDFDFSAKKKKKKPKKPVKEEDEKTETESSGEYSYDQLLKRIYSQLENSNMSVGQRTVKVPPPQLSAAARKTQWINFWKTCRVLNRDPDHIMQFFWAELGTTGAKDGENRLTIRGRFQSKQIQQVLRNYIQQYVMCPTCKSLETTLQKENRITFLCCQRDGSRTSVRPIDTGFHAVGRGERRANR